MSEVRNPMVVSFAVWKAIFLREALDRLFDMRAAWFWLLAEPVLHIGFLVFIFTVLRMRTVGNADVAVWIIVGMLAFFLFRRTAVQVTYAVDSNQPLFTYRQVKPFDPALARAVLEAFLMAIISTIILSVAALLSHDTWPHDPLLVLSAVFGLWLFGVGYGLVASVLMALVPEMEHILKILMLPLYLISGVIMPLVVIPQPYLDLLMLNPIAHGLELVRAGFFPYYHTVQGLSMEYLYAWAIVSLFLGLMLYRRFALQLVMK
ncbi:ABC transporter permease [Nitrosomonas sp.]|uniref:ABC transporter permease n=1 Tax=Nitrosomonas sp. TaxID=42353 RepID=UPI0025FB00C1|nr:ABC transporter permease [Nitrosomonas sp.]MBE7527706.1 ABC transporter permease [Burkholderiales bacterium]MCC6916060.1 ABC transporter permease [Nitrosomonas sp.]